MLLKDIRTNGNQSQLEWIRRLVPDREPTVGDLGRLVPRRQPRLVGTPDQIADKLMLWQAAGIDGVILVNWMIPASYREFADHLLPTLQKRGLAKQAYRPGTLRQKLFGSDRLNDRHPAAKYRGAFAAASRTAAG
jgi:hypothetical protein